MTSDPTRLAPTDSVMWEIERDPVLRSPILAIAVLDREPDAERVTRAFARAVESVPRLRQRVRSAGLRVGHVWQDDPSFALDHHLRRVRAPHPATMRTVLDMAQPVISCGFDRERALWEAHLIDGVEGGRSALVLKLHHALTDGVGGVAMAGALFDFAPDEVATSDQGRRVEAVPPHPLAHLLHEASVAVERSGRLLDTARSALLRPLDTSREARRTAASLARLLQPVGAPRSPILRGRGLARHLDTFDVDLDDLEGAARAVDGTVNDVFLAAVAGGLTRYHERHGAVPDRLRLTMPVSIRTDDDPAGGNRFVPVRFDIPLDVADPAERIRRLGELAHRWRNDPAIGWTDAIAAAVRLLPAPAAAGVLGGMFKAVDVDATNVPGVREPIWLAGAAVERLYAFAPPAGAALSVALLSHVGTACIGVETDTAAVDEPDSMTACLIEGFDQTVAVGGRAARGAGVR